MSVRRKLGPALCAACLGWVLTLSVLPASAVPAQADVNANRAKLDAAIGRLDKARSRAAAIDARVDKASERLDAVVAEQRQARTRLTSRASSMYRSGDTTFVSVLLGAETFQDFAVRWDLLTRMNEQDTADIKTLEAARREARRTARSLLSLQARQAESVDAIAAEVASARTELAASQSALAEYEARARAAEAKAEARRKAAAKKAEKTAKASSGSSDDTPEGTGAWSTAVASHYGRNFHGRGASGEKIGPYSMIVAHKTLPFGTLIEFKYRGRRAVAKVADRGPYTAGRTFDLGPGVVRVLGFSGVDEISYRIIGR